MKYSIDIRHNVKVEANNKEDAKIQAYGRLAMYMRNTVPHNEYVEFIDFNVREM